MHPKYSQKKLNEVFEETKLLGLIVSSDFKWKKNTEYITEKALSNFWMLRRIKEVGGNRQDLLDVYLTQIRCKVEQGCAAWNGALTKEDSKKIESEIKMIILTKISNHTGKYNYNVDKIEIIGVAIL